MVIILLMRLNYQKRNSDAFSIATTESVNSREEYLYRLIRMICFVLNFFLQLAN